MRTQRQQPATTVVLALAVVLAALWTGGPAFSAVSNPSDQLTAARSLPGIEPAALRDRTPALRPAVDRASQNGRLVPVLLGLLLSALAVAGGARAGRPRPGLARARPLAGSTQLEPRAPPSLQPA